MKKFSHKPFEKYKGDHCKFYIAKFIRKKDKLTFHKFGVTTYKNAEDRFKHEPNQYKDYDISIKATIICESKKAAEKVERFFTKKYPKNISLLVEDHKHMPELGFSGITEIHQCRNGSWPSVFSDYLEKKGQYACKFTFTVK